MLVKRLIAFVLVFFPLFTYVYGLELIYEKTSKSGPSYSAAAIFVAVLLLGSAAYDFVKRVLFMPPATFLRFYQDFVASVVAVFGMLVFCIFSGLCFAHPDKIPEWFAVVLYIVALMFASIFMLRFTKAIEVAANEA